MTDFDLGRDVVDQVRQATDLLEVVGEHVRLKRRGRKYEGLCPFHQEKTPSFSVDPDRGLYYCFGCHQGGDLFKFVMQTEQLTFGEAVERLAGRFGVKLPPRSPDASRRRLESDRIRSLLEEAQARFTDQLLSPAGVVARRELERRGFQPSCWPEFGFGWAPDEWRWLTDLLKRRHPEGALIAAGLAVQPEAGSSAYDRFRGRLTFPIRSPDGGLIGFGGRILGAGEPKYLNSPESPLFHKRSTLFGLDRARQKIRTTQEVVVVEGYFDCFSLHRVGIGNVVATLGTALTSDHARLLRRELGDRDRGAGTPPRVLLCYDADPAGRRAAVTGIRELLQAGIGVAVVELPEGCDPDDTIRQGGADAARELLAQPTPLVDYLLADLPEAPGQRQRAGAALAELIGIASDPHARGELLIELRDRLGLTTEVVRDLMARVGGSRPATSARTTRLPAGEAMLVRIILDGGPSWRRVIARELEPALRSDPRVTRLLEALRSFEAEPDADRADFAGWLVATLDDEAVTTLVAEIAVADSPDLTDDAIRRQLELTLTEQRRGQSRRLTAAIRTAERDGDQGAVARLQAELQLLRSRSPDL